MKYRKRIISLILSILLLSTCNSAFAAKARSISTDADSLYHAEHLKRHLGETECFATGNYIKTRSKASESKVIGHLEQADEFILLDVKNGWAQIEVTDSDKNSPDSWKGMTGWVNSDYVDCDCSSDSYHSSVLSASTLSYPFPEGMPDGWSHSSGVGAWSIELRINQNGSFYGYFYDADMGDSGEGYLNGTRYECLFYGQFTDIHPIALNVYSMTVSNSNMIGNPDSQFIYDDVRHILLNLSPDIGDIFYIYTPGAAKQSISEEHLSWLHGTITDPISSYALCNMEDGTAFDPGSDYPNDHYFPSNYHFSCTANNLRIRNKPNGDQILGHLEKEDYFVVNGIVDGWANVIVIKPANTSSDSLPGLAGWVSMDHLTKN